MKSIIVMFMLCAMGAAAQMVNWALPPNKAYMIGTPTATTLPGSPSSTPYIVSNGAYDETTGNLLFYVKDNGIYDALGSYAGTLADYPGNYSALQNEIAIVPVPGTCADYYIIYSKLNMNTINHLALMYTKIRKVGNSLTVLNNGVLIDNSYQGNAVGIAVSKPFGNMVNGNRSLFAMGYPYIKRYTISATGINSALTMLNISSREHILSTSDMNASELELSSDEGYLSWVAYGEKAFRFNLATLVTNAVIVNTSSPALDNKHCGGIEFKSGSGSIVYVSMFGSPVAGGAINGGIYKVDFSTSAVTAIITGGVCNMTHLEGSKDGYIYGVNSSTATLSRLNQSSEIVTNAIMPNTIYSNEPSGIFYALYRLPDQVDGQGYSNFSGVPPATYSLLKAYNNGARVLPVSGLHNLFNCQSITLSPAASSTTEYKLSLYTSDISGNKITGPGLLDYVGSWTVGTYPTSLDLRTLSSNYLMTHTGYYTAVVDVKGPCNELSKNVILNISDISSFSSAFKLNYGDGNLINAGTSYANPAPTGQLLVGIDASNSTGYLDYYEATIRKVNASTGAVIEQVCNPSSQVLITNHAPSSMGSIPLNGLIKNKCAGPTGYLSLPANVNQVYELTFKVGNICGTSSSTGYFTNTDDNYRVGESELTSVATAVKFFPNPANTTARLNYSLSEAREVSLKLFNAQGKEVLAPVLAELQNKGDHSITIDISSLPKGVYLYQLNTGEFTSGQFMVE